MHVIIHAVFAIHQLFFVCFKSKTILRLPCSHRCSDIFRGCLQSGKLSRLAARSSGSRCGPLPTTTGEARRARDRSELFPRTPAIAMIQQQYLLIARCSAAFTLSTQRIILKVERHDATGIYVSTTEPCRVRSADSNFSSISTRQSTSTYVRVALSRVPVAMADARPRSALHDAHKFERAFLELTTIEGLPTPHFHRTGVSI